MTRDEGSLAALPAARNKAADASKAGEFQIGGADYEEAYRVAVPNLV